MSAAFKPGDPVSAYSSDGMIWADYAKVLEVHQDEIGGYFYKLDWQSQTMWPESGLQPAPMMGLDTVRWLEGVGGAFCLVAGAAATGSSPGKRPLGDGWQNAPQTVSAVETHLKKSGNAGLICGKLSNGLILLDFDQDAQQLFALFPWLASCPRFERSNAGSRTKLLIRVTDGTPPGKKYHYPMPTDPNRADPHPFFEILGQGNQGVIAGMHQSGVAIGLVNWQHQPHEMTMADLDAFVSLWAANSYELLQAQPPTNLDDDMGEFISKVRASWDTLKVFEHFGRANHVVKENGQLRLKDNGGLFVKSDGSWAIPGNGQGCGGGPFEAWTYCESGTAKKLTGADFVKLAIKMGRAAGIPVPDRRTATATASGPGAAASAKQQYKKRASPSELMAILTAAGYKFSKRETDEALFINGRRAVDDDLSEIKTYLRELGYQNVDHAIDAAYVDAKQHKFHPVRDYLNSLQWDGLGHIQHMADHVTDRAGLFPAMLRRWAIGAVARAFESTQNRVLIMAGGQGCGKSFFVRHLASGLPEYYSESAPDLDNKDSQLALSTVWIWELTELDGLLRRRDRAQIKAWLTQQTIKVRPPYGRLEIEKTPMASFIGTANYDGAGILSDPGGSRRFMVAEILSIDWAYVSNVSIPGFWAEAVTAYRNGEQWNLTPEEAAQVDKENKKHENVSDVFDWLDAHIEIDEIGNSFCSSLDITMRLQAAGIVHGSPSRDIANWMRQKNIETEVRRVGGKLTRGYPKVILV